MSNNLNHDFWDQTILVSQLSVYAWIQSLTLTVTLMVQSPIGGCSES